MSGINVTATGDLTIQQTEGGSKCPSTQSDLFAFPIALNAQGLIGISGTGGTEVSQACFTINSPASFVSLAFPTSLRARVVYFRVLTGGPFDVRLTHAVAGVVTHPGQYFLLTQCEQTEGVSQIEVQGSGSFAWVAVGTTV